MTATSPIPSPNLGTSPRLPAPRRPRRRGSCVTRWRPSPCAAPPTRTRCGAAPSRWTPMSAAYMAPSPPWTPPRSTSQCLQCGRRRVHRGFGVVFKKDKTRASNGSVITMVHRGAAGVKEDDCSVETVKRG
ncbi:hypothetical protein VPH35_111577 [Triticum aestivum]